MSQKFLHIQCIHQTASLQLVGLAKVKFNLKMKKSKYPCTLLRGMFFKESQFYIIVILQKQYIFDIFIR